MIIPSVAISGALLGQISEFKKLLVARDEELHQYRQILGSSVQRNPKASLSSLFNPITYEADALASGKLREDLALSRNSPFASAFISSLYSYFMSDLGEKAIESNAEEAEHAPGSSISSENQRKQTEAAEEKDQNRGEASSQKEGAEEEEPAKKKQRKSSAKKGKEQPIPADSPVGPSSSKTPGYKETEEEKKRREEIEKSLEEKKKKKEQKEKKEKIKKAFI